MSNGEQSIEGYVAESLLAETIINDNDSSKRKKTHHQSSSGAFNKKKNLTPTRGFLGSWRTFIHSDFEGSC
ncbi:hypothetical protein K1719_019117 [Acacia pycnantha]|nr:hypothetical protein K1719_019117 [Acacia pycnantha]